MKDIRMSFTEKELIFIKNSLEDRNFMQRVGQPKVSIIVPCFNTERFISKCLFSIINQTEQDIEIICVNDGSTDDTLKIINLFAKYDSRIKILNQEHKLQGAARNSGMANANGEYIGFVDSDDWVDLDYFEKLYNAAKKYNSDLALATNVRIGNGKTKKRLNIKKEEFITTLQDKIDACCQWKDGCPTNKIYNKEFLTKYNISFPEGVYCEDKIFTTKAIYYANGIVTVPDIYYYYFRNPNSTVNNKIKINKRKQDKNNARLEVLNFLKEQKAPIRDGDFCAITKEIEWVGIPIYRKKESLCSAKHYILSFIKVKDEKF